MSVIDTALLASSCPDEEGSDWEYEYHDTETETFYLNLDLTTLHGPIRAPRRRNDTSASAAPVSNATSDTANPTTPASSRPGDQDPDMKTTETDKASSERVQILGLHTRNPVISYQNQIFSGSWADQLGTELFFARPVVPGSEPDDPESTPAQITPLRHTNDYDLIAANSVKVLARKANLISSSGSAVATDQREASSAATSTLETSTVAYKPEHQSNQARFLDRLKDIKRQKGERDTVRTVFSTHRRNQNLEDRLRGWAQTEEQLTVIRQLNVRAVQGDVDAVRELERMYTQLSNQDTGPSEGPSRPA
ncbi:hypothetical protein BJY04DRAFT_146679 [Aspergillus karnatakaensis]|uniref:TFIIIC subunit 6 family protein n=1 Tax=Aspergillus karnatakaensis TaxID=1810916 RepID=UPI003CCD6D57